VGVVRALVVVSLTMVLLVAGAACGPSRRAETPRIPFSALRCTSRDAPTCAPLKRGGVGCCTPTPDGAEHRFRCPSHGKAELQAKPVPIPGLAGVAAIADGGYTRCARLVDGTVRCWGSNDDGELGLGAYPDTSALTVWIHGAGSEGVGVIPAGVKGDHRCARFADGSVRCAPLKEKFEGPECRAKARGTAVYMECAEGALPAEAMCHYAPAPVRVTALQDVAQLAGASRRFCAVTSGGSVRCWGRNANGEINPRRASYGLPLPTELALPLPAVQVSIGSNGGCALLQDATAHCWMASGGSRREPSGPVPLQRSVAQVVGDAARGCVRHTSGWAECWAVGWGVKSTPWIHPLQLPGLDAVTDIALGNHFGCAVQRGEVWCWGANRRRQLGDGTTESRETARRVPGLANVTQVVAAGDGACVRTSDGAVHCWGRDQPVHAREMPGPVRSLGSGARCAVLQDGSAWCWGRVVPPAADRTSADPALAIKSVNPPKPLPLRLPPPPTYRCERSEVFCCGPYCFDAEDVCLDQRASGQRDCGCTKHRRMRLLEIIDGRSADISCNCLASRECRAAGGHRTCTPLPHQDALCEDNIVSDKRAAASRNKARWCTRGRVEDCYIPGGPGDARPTCRLRSTRACHRSRRECEKQAREFKQIEARCAPYAPKRSSG